IYDEEKNNETNNAKSNPLISKKNTTNKEKNETKIPFFMVAPKISSLLDVTINGSFIISMTRCKINDINASLKKLPYSSNP
ncbi:hypothetical protein OD808_19575, partial [Aeromonas veronii]|uniref:hypothetical protein n=1 Tax=Aeromonas veronii TaxID=654 RepID=UPI002246397E